MRTLTERQRQVLTTLLNTDSPMTVQTLATAHQVSVRTLRYDLGPIRAWLEAHETALSSKAHTGVWLEATQQTRSQLRQKLDQTVHDVALVPSARVVSLVLALAQAPGYVTLAQLQLTIDVSVTTLKNDLKTLRRLVKRFEVKLVSRNYYGFRLEGQEAAIRHLVEQLLMEGLERKSLPAAVAQALTRSVPPATTLVLTANVALNELFNTVLALAVAVAQTMSPPPLTRVLALLVRLSVTVMRRQLAPLPPGAVVASVPEDFIGALVQQTSQYFALQFAPEDTARLLGHAPATTANLAHTTQQLIASVSHDTGLAFSEDHQLQAHLFMHLSQDVTGQAVPYSPFTHDLKARHAVLFQAIKTHATSLLAGDQPVEEAFVTHIALHFLAAAQRLVATPRTVRVVYVCATGLGIAKLLQQRVTQAISHLEIVGFTGLEHALDLIVRERPDLVISIFPLKTPGIPVVEVQPLPTALDLAAIQAVVTKVLMAPNKVPPLDSPQAEALPKLTQDALVRMFSVYAELKELLPTAASAYQDAFMMHVFLAVHRILFDQQYQGQTVSLRAPLATAITQVFTRHGLRITPPEVQALLAFVTVIPQKGGEDHDDSQVAPSRR